MCLCIYVCECVFLVSCCVYTVSISVVYIHLHRKYIDNTKKNPIQYDIYTHTHTNEGRTTIAQSLLCNRCRSRHDIHTCSYMYVPLARNPRSQCVSLLIYTRVRASGRARLALRCAPFRSRSTWHCPVIIDIRSPSADHEPSLLSHTSPMAHVHCES